VTKTELFHWPAILLAVAVFLLMREKHLKKLHPIVFIAASAVAGVLFQM
jgi:chromate transporter